MFARLGRWCYRRRWMVVIAWIVTLVVGFTTLSALGTESRSSSACPTSSQAGPDILDDHFGGFGAGFGGSVVFRRRRGRRPDRARGHDRRALDRIAQLGDLEITSPYAREGARRSPPRAPRRARSPTPASTCPRISRGRRRPRFASDIKRQLPKDLEGVEIELGGGIFADFEAPSSEAIGVGFAIIILVLAFGSVLAMGLPISVALAGIGVGSVLVGFSSMPDFTSILGVMIGLGVGIDYAPVHRHPLPGEPPQGLRPRALHGHRHGHGRPGRAAAPPS